jgi:predicted dehydrogenase
VPHRTDLRVGIIGTGAVAHLHARAHQNAGHQVRACTNRNETTGRAFADAYDAEFIGTVEQLCSHPDVDIIDVCTFPAFRLPAVEACASHGKSILVEKPMATSVGTARTMIATAAAAGIRLGVVSQHRFDTANQFLSRAIRDGRLGKLVECDAYVKWHRSDEYYARPVKGSWDVEGGGALINQAIHQIDLLLWFGGPVSQVAGMWQLGAAHAIESEDVVNAVLRYASGATGVIQASTACWPGSSERIEVHGVKGTAVIAGDRLVTWQVRDDRGDPPPLAGPALSGASDPLAISLESFERQFRDFGAAVRGRRAPLVSGEEGYRALELVDGIYRSCREQRYVSLEISSDMIGRSAPGGL